ncbi:MAG TPA: sulfite exporter TauE/SafE family protein [Povalibacter sp.]|mgnify:CR=1 FL=1|uniref:sulfite exporter TauE/SafE family protein n=1 Tax=Povalibacter sp. TaxID=1962978 RepID=UPI002BBD6007|nr:sulfite exporter TauE/SafE family protein [Povalibacter sp.]HMN43075.1 sulfite exporter TauE/SafE family protein [Povalibacter sp.]
MNALTLTAALLLGLAASGHCVVMCGGISSALSLATAKNAAGRPRPTLLFGYQLGRVTSYTLAGLLFGGVLGGVVRLLDIESIRIALRAFSAAALLFAALVVLGRVRDPGFGIGHRWWSKLAPLGRKLLPVATLPRAFAFGTLWGWMPCGFVYTVLVMASLQFDAVRGAAIMAAFGLGTAPALFAAALGAPRLAAAAARPAARQAAGSILLVSAALTLAGPWLVHAVPGLSGMLPFDC